MCNDTKCSVIIGFNMLHLCFVQFNRYMPNVCNLLCGVGIFNRTNTPTLLLCSMVFDILGYVRVGC